MSKSVININVKADGSAEASNSIKKLGDAIAKTGQKAFSVSKLIQGVAIGNMIASGVQKAAEAVKNFTSGSLGSYKIQEQAETKLGAVLKATGESAGFTQKQLQDYASELQNITTIGDETYLSSMSIIAAFRNIKGDQFKQATLQAANMSTVLGVGLTEATKKVGRALAEPAKAFDMLKESGIVVSEELKQKMKNLTGAGKNVAAQQLILIELEKRFGGAAEAAAGTASGKLIQIGNALGDVKEGIGAIFSEILNLDLGFNLVEQIGNIAASLRKNASVIATIAKNIIISMMVFGKNLYTVFKGIVEVCYNSFLNIVEAGRWAMDVLTAIWNDMPGFWGAVWADVKQTVDDTWDFIATLFTSSFEMWISIGKSFAENWKSIFTDIWEVTKRSLTSVGTFFQECFKNIGKMAASLGSNFWALVTGKKSFSEAVGGVFKDFKKMAEETAKEVGKNWEGYEIGSGTKQFGKDAAAAVARHAGNIAGAGAKIGANAGKNVGEWYKKSGVKDAKLFNPMKGVWDDMKKEFAENAAWGEELKRKNFNNAKKVAKTGSGLDDDEEGAYQNKAATMATQGSKEAYKLIMAFRNNGENKLPAKQLKAAESSAESLKTIKDKLDDFNVNSAGMEVFSI